MISGQVVAERARASAVAPLQSTVHVVVSCDANYVRHLAVLLLSLAEHHPPEALQVHFLAPPGLDEAARLTAALGVHAACFTCHVVDAGRVAALKTYDDNTVAAYHRLLMAECLPAELDRVIYLDCDMIVRSSLMDLWNMDLDGHVVAAAADPAWRRWEVLGLPVGAPYFNSGLMVVDLARWRAERVGAECLAFAAEHPGRLSYADQCALNWVLQGRWMRLDPVWNLQSYYLCRTVEGELAYFDPVPAIAGRACVVHFNSPSRPWLYMDRHPFKAEYERYARQTPWRDTRPPDRYLGNRILRFLRDHAPVLMPIYGMLRGI